MSLCIYVCVCARTQMSVCVFINFLCNSVMQVTVLILEAHNQG